MGPPANKAAEGTTEVWGYSSGNEQQQCHVKGRLDNPRAFRFAIYG